MIKHKKACWGSTYPPSLPLESQRTGMFLMEVEIGSGYPKYPYKALMKLSPRSNIRKLIETPPILQVSSWRLRGLWAGDGVRVLKISLESVTESFIKIQHQEPCQDSTFPPSLFLESWRTVILDGAGDGIRVLKISQGSFTESYIKIQH